MRRVLTPGHTRQNATDPELAPPRVSLEQLKTLLEAIVRVPKAWATFIVALVIASSIHFIVTRGWHVTGTFRLTGLTVILIALLWLPSFIRVVALVGGNFTAPGASGGTPGLASILHWIDWLPERDQREFLPGMIAKLGTAELRAPLHEQESLEATRDNLELRLGFLLETEQTSSPESRLLNYIHELHDLRNNETKSRTRTIQMEAIVAEIRALAKIVDFDQQSFERLLTRSESERVAALALLQGQPTARYFELVLRGVEEPISRFEQYQALRAIEEIVSLLGAGQRRRLQEALQAVQSEIGSNSDRGRLIQRLLAELGND